MVFAFAHKAFSRAFVVSSLVMALAEPSAHAVIYIGNPNLGFHVDRQQHDYVSGSVDLDTVRVHHCGGGYTDYPVGQTIDPVDGFDVAIAAGNHCSVTLFWGSVMVVDGPSYSLEYDEASTAVTLASPIAAVSGLFRTASNASASSVALEGVTR